MQDKLKKQRKDKPGQTFKCQICGKQVCSICSGRGCINCYYIDHYRYECIARVDEYRDD